MANTRAIVKRRKAIRNIRKITRTMELIAAARFKKAMDRATEAEAYTRKIAELAANLSASATDITHPLLEKHEPVKNGVILVLSSNRGLCGGYNAAVLREAAATIRKQRAEGINLQIELSGKRAIAFCKYQGIKLDRTFTKFEDKPTFDEVEEIANRYIADYIAKKIDRVEVAYTRFINVARQVAVVETLLPLSSATTDDAKKPATKTTNIEYEFVPSANDILQELLPTSFKVRLFKCFLDAAVSEQIARRVAMKAATESAGDMIKSLSQQYNRARQAQITKEISEIIGGVEALK